ncbi:MAG: Ldh family oxidoreductase [Chloroflexi bacterium]|nr:Ldh family oxidoreductase [Chloroflexota bacterium]
MVRTVEIDKFVTLIAGILAQNGMSSDEASIVIEHLLDGELTEKPSHGFVRIPQIVRDLRKKPPKYIVIENETPISALLNSGNKTGLIAALRATELVIGKAKKSKFGIVGGYNITGTVGAIGYYTRRIAESDLIGFMVCNSENAMPPTGGYSLIFGTNPLSISFPASREPIVVDFATSKMTFGDLLIAMKEGRSIPEGIILDKDGNPSTNPNDAWEGPMLTIAGHKGYALALAIEILAGPLVKAKAGAMAVQGSDGFTIAALDPSLFVPIAQFKSQVDSLIREIKASRRLPGVDEIFFPGEQSNRKRLQNKGKKILHLPEQVVKEIEELARG